MQFKPLLTKSLRITTKIAGAIAFLLLLRWGGWKGLLFILLGMLFMILALTRYATITNFFMKAFKGEINLLKPDK